MLPNARFTFVQQLNDGCVAYFNMRRHVNDQHPHKFSYNLNVSMRLTFKNVERNAQHREAKRHIEHLWETVAQLARHCKIDGIFISFCWIVFMVLRILVIWWNKNHFSNEQLIECEKWSGQWLTHAQRIFFFFLVFAIFCFCLSWSMCHSIYKSNICWRTERPSLPLKITEPAK